VPDRLASWIPLIQALAPYVVALVAAVVAWRVGNAALKAKDARMDELKEQIATLNRRDVKWVNDRFDALVAQSNGMHAELQAQIDELKNQNELTETELRDAVEQQDVQRQHIQALNSALSGVQQQAREQRAGWKHSYAEAVEAHRVAQAESESPPSADS
jgi:septal ring factor EnvC (AmiA/AmiB activator)